MAVITAPAVTSGLYADPREDWLALHSEEIIDPARRIVDPHHHLWHRGGLHYMIEEMAAGRAPLFRGEAGYSPHLDPDGDGLACPTQ